MKEIHHWIDGKEAEGGSGRFADVFNPATGEVQAKVALASKSELDAAIAPEDVSTLYNLALLVQQTQAVKSLGPDGEVSVIFPLIGVSEQQKSVLSSVAWMENQSSSPRGRILPYTVPHLDAGYCACFGPGQKPVKSLSSLEKSPVKPSSVLLSQSLSIRSQTSVGLDGQLATHMLSLVQVS